MRLILELRIGQIVSSIFSSAIVFQPKVFLQSITLIEQNCLELLRIIIHYLNYESNIAVFWKESKIKRDLSDGSKTGKMIPRNHEKVAQEVTLMKLIFLRKVLSQLAVGKFYLTV